MNQLKSKTILENYYGPLKISNYNFFFMGTEFVVALELYSKVNPALNLYSKPCESFNSKSLSDSEETLCAPVFQEVFLKVLFSTYLRLSGLMWNG
jgi:hypothetical protein